ncbi:hypothetical protein [Actinomadura sp. WMMA1423]|uniref:hypothetical protein n=1 Tax=Actinomadura sp. WMMA1423 TaxID=2591108 RepID=UPI00114684BD|nr:hypothetical protein [Actinomadura sp. WMMA1423]
MADRFRGQDHDNQYGGLDEYLAEDEYAAEETYPADDELGGEDEFGGVHPHVGHEDASLEDEEAMQQEQGGMPPRADDDYDVSTEDFTSDMEEDESAGSW